MSRYNELLREFYKIILNLHRDCVYVEGIQVLLFIF